MGIHALCSSEAMSPVDQTLDLAFWHQCQHPPLTGVWVQSPIAPVLTQLLANVKLQHSVSGRSVEGKVHLQRTPTGKDLLSPTAWLWVCHVDSGDAPSTFSMQTTLWPTSPTRAQATSLSHAGSCRCLRAHLPLPAASPSCMTTDRSLPHSAGLG